MLHTFTKTNKTMIFVKKIGLILCLQLFISQAYAQWPANINVITTETNVSTTTEGKLEDGKVVDLAWGHHSANNCFPESAKDNFRGKHVLYTTYLPPHSKVTITLKPADTLKMSLYAYMVGVNNFSSIVPSVHSCIICKSDYPPIILTDEKDKKNGKNSPKSTPKNNTKSDKPKPQPEVIVKTVGNMRVVELKSAGNQAYNVMFGVAGVGVEGTKGNYTLEVLVK
jgi:hypothetical protein